jgi:RNA polymerase sigma factor for flagellar operon FliA
MHRTVRACAAGSQLAKTLAQSNATTKDFAQEAISALARSDSGLQKTIILDALCAFLIHLSTGPVRRCAKLKKALALGEARQILEDAWDEKPSTKDITFDEAVINLGMTVSSSELGWALISLESSKHVKLIWQQANKLANSYPGVDASDMLSWGWIGLRTALRHYNPDLGFRFSTYACTRITGTIRDGVRSEKPVPKRLGTFARKVTAAEEHLTQKLGRTPTLEEVSEHLDVDLAQVELAARAQAEASLDDIVLGASMNGYTPNWLIGGEDTGETALTNLCRQAVEEALLKLDPEEANAVRLLVMEAVHPTEARKMAGVSARQMRQRKDRALKKLKEELADWS